MLICNPAPPASPAQASSFPAAPQENKSRTVEQQVYSEQLQLLQSMGFIQRETNLQLLAKHNGNIEFCINELLQD